MNTYYSNYYNLRKHLYKVRYYEKKDEEQRDYELYKDFGGKKEFYKNSLINMGFLVIKKIDLKDEEKDISNNDLLSGTQRRNEK
jgi:uncharacterized membrane protein